MSASAKALSRRIATAQAAQSFTVDPPQSAEQLLAEPPLRADSVANSVSDNCSALAVEVDEADSATQRPSSGCTDADTGTNPGSAAASDDRSSQYAADESGSRAACQRVKPQQNGTSSAASTATGTCAAPPHSSAGSEEDLASLADVLQTCLTSRIDAQYRLMSQAVLG